MAAVLEDGSVVQVPKLTKDQEALYEGIETIAQEDARRAETRTIHDPFLGKSVEVSDRLTDRLRGRYANGPTMPNGEPEFGWNDFTTAPIQHEAAARIELLESVVKRLSLGLMKIRTMQGDPIQIAREAMECAVLPSSKGE